MCINIYVHIYTCIHICVHVYMEIICTGLQALDSSSWVINRLWGLGMSSTAYNI